MWRSSGHYRTDLLAVGGCHGLLPEERLVGHGVLARAGVANRGAPGLEGFFGERELGGTADGVRPAAEQAPVRSGFDDLARVGRVARRPEFASFTIGQAQEPHRRRLVDLGLLVERHDVSYSSFGVLAEFVVGVQEDRGQRVLVG